MWAFVLGYMMSNEGYPGTREASVKLASQRLKKRRFLRVLEI
jgi:hypothetical protein